MHPEDDFLHPMTANPLRKSWHDRVKEKLAEARANMVTDLPMLETAITPSPADLDGVPMASTQPDGITWARFPPSVDPIRSEALRCAIEVFKARSYPLTSEIIEYAQSFENYLREGVDKPNRTA